ncbi:hypothetical protein [Microcoleus sp. herbarium2]|uniref:hypothetical protein n=1 Tax=Microcoleus sp. herbarium2 TaxID=3055433 RepID=UPI002FCF4B80
MFTEESFSVNWFTKKGNLVFMGKLYHKVAVTSVCTALGFALGANEEAYSATFALPPTINFEVIDYSNKLWNENYNYFYYEYDGVGD